MELFDAHFHVIDPRFPLVPNQGYLPEAFTAADYRAAMAGLNAGKLTGGAVVSGSFQAFDQDYLIAALGELGSGFVGVTQLPGDVTDAEIERLHGSGVRGLRFNLRRGGSAGMEELAPLARRVHKVAGWHAELYVDAAEIDSGLESILRTLPAVSIDHLGLSREGLSTLVGLAEHGVRVKATGFGRLDFDPAEALERLHHANPAALIFGTDLPGTRAPRPFAIADLELIVKTLGEDEAERVLCTNARDFYRLPEPDRRERYLGYGCGC